MPEVVIPPRASAVPSTDDLAHQTGRDRHMIMLDKNNLQVADVILAWMRGHVDGR